jgi:hypothetical protein
MSTRRKLIVACMVIGIGISASADYGFRPNGEQSLTDLSKWGSASSLTEKEKVSVLSFNLFD